MTPQFITVHNTTYDVSTPNEIKYMNSNRNEVSYYVAIDDKGLMLGIVGMDEVMVIANLLAWRFVTLSQVDYDPLRKKKMRCNTSQNY